MQANRALPDNIQNAPELDLGLQLYLQAFFDLDSERNNGMGLARIPSSAVRAYAREFDFSEDQSDSLSFFVSEMDEAHIKRLQAKQDAASKTKSKK